MLQPGHISHQHTQFTFPRPTQDSSKSHNIPLIMMPYFYHETDDICKNIQYCNDNYDVIMTGRTSVFGMWSRHLTWAICCRQRMSNCSNVVVVVVCCLELLQCVRGSTTHTRRVGKSRWLPCRWQLWCLVGCYDRSKDVLTAG